jgi:hypothetical protein
MSDELFVQRSLNLYNRYLCIFIFLAMDRFSSSVKLLSFVQELFVLKV